MYEEGALPQPVMCRWHCRCEYCEFDSGYLFRAQTDSSCSGEVISSILHHDPDHRLHPALDPFLLLQEASLAVDSEPGLGAGLHVHVGMNLTPSQQDRALWAYLKYEPLLVRLAAGRFPEQRENNQSVESMVSSDLRHLTGTRRSRDALAYVEECEDEEFYAETLARTRMVHQGNDRHSNLNLNTGHGTWEFRLWNSTRSAWRMELFTRLSVALVDPDVTDALIESDLPRRYSRQLADTFATIILDAGHDRCAELLDRQATYTWDRAHNAPSSLTIF